MDDLLERLRAQVEQSTTAIEPDEVCIRGGGRRRSRLLNLAAVAAVVALVVGLALARRDPSPEAEPAVVPAPAYVVVTAIEVNEKLGGTEEVVFVFDGPLPDDEAAFVEDIERVKDPVGLAYTTQNPSLVHVCSDRHFFGDVPGGTVDLLLPLDWGDPSVDLLQAPPTYGPGVEHPGKIVSCRAFGRGFIQLSIWGAPSDDPADVSVSVDPTRTRVTVEMQQEAAVP